MEERVHFYKSCLLLMLQLMVAYLEACLSDFYFRDWVSRHFWYVSEFLVSRVPKDD